jgi:hypothetical protein
MRYLVSALALIASSAFAQSDMDRRLFETDRYLSQPRYHNAPINHPAYPNQAVIQGQRCLPPPVPCNPAQYYGGYPSYPGGVRFQIGVQIPGNPNIGVQIGN